MYCSILWNALHYNYVAGVALQQAACWFSSAKVVEIVRQFNQKMLQLRQKFCQIVRFILFRSEKCTFCNTACSMFCFDLRLDTEKLRNIKITTKIHSSILIGYSCQSVLPEHISNHKIWLRWHIFDYFITYIFGKYWGFQRI